MPLEIELNNPSCILHHRYQVFLDDYVDENPDASAVEVRYNGAMGFMRNEMEEITSLADENGKIEPSDLDTRKKEILQLYLDQQVCLLAFTMHLATRLLKFYLYITKQTTARMAKCMPSH